VQDVHQGNLERPGLLAFLDMISRFFNSTAMRHHSRLSITELLPRLEDMINEVRQTTSIKDKTAIVQRFSDLHPFLESLYKSGRLHLTSSALDKQVLDNVTDTASYIFVEDLISDLESRSIAGHAAIRAVQSVLLMHEKHGELIRNIIDKDLRIRMGSKLILKAIGVEGFELPVALAEDIKDESSKKYFKASLTKGEVWFASRKLDGIRCLAFCSKAGGSKWSIELNTRQGRQLSRLANVIRAIKESLRGSDAESLILDGELCVVENGLDSKENFRAAASIVGSKEPDDSALSFVIFDALVKDEFTKNSQSESFGKRQERLWRHVRPSQSVSLLPHFKIDQASDYERMVEQSRLKGWEGVMLRRDAVYQGRRSRDLLKCKEFHDAEFIIVGYSTAPIRLIEDGFEKTEELISNIKIEYKGLAVEVGSGFSMEERRQFRDLGEALLGRKATICYFEESQRKGPEGSRPSLRFPTFKCLRD